mmetsp:Transcript_16100/g.56279  ORF Transcript_16100/g.56279 Transcript_16100/m.56279 type:complete len:283 (+) Transcript_16100:304-1152(+)
MVPFRPVYQAAVPRRLRRLRLRRERLRAAQRILQRLVPRAWLRLLFQPVVVHGGAAPLRRRFTARRPHSAPHLHGISDGHARHVGGVPHLPPGQPVSRQTVARRGQNRHRAHDRRFHGARRLAGVPVRGCGGAAIIPRGGVCGPRRGRGAGAGRRRRAPPRHGLCEPRRVGGSAGDALGFDHAGGARARVLAKARPHVRFVRPRLCVLRLQVARAQRAGRLRPAGVVAPVVARLRGSRSPGLALRRPRLPRIRPPRRALQMRRALTHSHAGGRRGIRRGIAR